MQTILSYSMSILHRMSQIVTSSKSPSASCISLTATNSRTRSCSLQSQQASQDKVCEVASLVLVQEARLFWDQSKLQSMWTSHLKKSTHQFVWTWDFLVIPSLQAHNPSFQWLRWATTKLHSRHAAPENQYIRLSNSTTQVTHQYNSRSCKTLPALTNPSRLLEWSQGNHLLLPHLNSTPSHQDSITSLHNLCSTTLQQMCRQFFCKDTAMDHRSVCLKISYSTHLLSKECRPSRSSVWRMIQEFLLSMNGVCPKNTKTKSVSHLTKRYYHQMKKQSLSQFSPLLKRKSTK